MIVNPLDSGWEIVFQRAHEMLAMQIATHWKKENRPARWAELLSAIAEHDNRQQGWKGRRHLNKAGAPLDFTQKGFTAEQATGVTEVARYKSSYVALLISMHASYLYEPFRGTGHHIDSFLDTQLQNQKSWRSSLRLTKEEARRDYNILHWADRCSLILCKNELPADEHKLEIFEDNGGKLSFIRQRKSGHLEVDPWPFEEPEFEVWVEARSVERLTFENDEDLAQTLFSAKAEEKKWVFRRKGL